MDSATLTEVQLREEVELLNRQVLFVYRLWHEHSEHAKPAYRSVVRNAHRLKIAATVLGRSRVSNETWQTIQDSLHILSMLKGAGFHVEGSGALGPAPINGRIRSVQSAGPPGSGRRR